jgi:isoleucyl-tRNA synthetase
VIQQSESFQRYGIFGDFDNPYLTLQPEFEAAQIRVFGEMFKKGFIFRGRKPVHWSPSSRTALAEAELEYPEGHISKSIYVAFPVQEPSDAIKEHHSEESPIKVAIWTTTPWTMPANMAIAVNPDLSYSVVQHESTGKLIVATDLIGTLSVRFCTMEINLKSSVYSHFVFFILVLLEQIWIVRRRYVRCLVHIVRLGLYRNNLHSSPL